MSERPAPDEILGADLLSQIASRGGIRSFPVNAVLIHEGDTADSLFIVLSGRVKVYATGVGGREVVIDTHAAGEYVGELALDGGVRSASVMTLEPTSCAIVTGATLRDFVAEHPEFALHLIRKLIRRVRHATESVKSLALEDVYVRVVRLLAELSDPASDGTRLVSERLTQQAIADRVGASREMVNRIFKDLTTGGYVTVVSSRITVLKRPPPAW